MKTENLWQLAQKRAKENYQEENPGGDWDELDKYEREDRVFTEFENLKNTSETKLICPNCGTEMKLPETSSFVAGMTLSKESGGTHVLEADVVKNNNISNKKERKNMNTKMEQFKKAGVDTSKFFQVALPGGGSVTMTYGANGVPVIVPEGEAVTTEATKDPIYAQIISDGYVRNTKLHRRWVMAQMFRMLSYKSRISHGSGYDCYLRENYGYMYQFSMMLEEVRVLSKLEERDAESFAERSHFFSKEVVVATCKDYMDKLKIHADSLKRKNCKGVPYVTLQGKNIFEADLSKKVYKPQQYLISRM